MWEKLYKSLDILITIAAIVILVSMAFLHIIPSRNKNCSDFHGNYEKAREFFFKHDPARDPHGLDRDNDNDPCESLKKN